MSALRFLALLLIVDLVIVGGACWGIQYAVVHWLPFGLPIERIVYAMIFTWIAYSLWCIYKEKRA